MQKVYARGLFLHQKCFMCPAHFADFTLMPEVAPGHGKYDQSSGDRKRMDVRGEVQNGNEDRETWCIESNLI